MPAPERMPRFTPDDLDDEQRALYDAIASGPRATGPQHFPLTHADGSLAGPFNALLVQPALGTAVQELGAAIRYRTSLSPRVRELAILMVASSWNSTFERFAHEAVGRAAGLSEREIADMRMGLLPQLSDPVELASLRAVRALITGDIDDELWTRLREHLDERTIFELSTLVGYYALLALQLRAFRADTVPVSA